MEERNLLKQINDIPRLTQNDFKILYVKWVKEKNITRKTTLQNQLIEPNLRIAGYHALKFHEMDTSLMMLEDLISEGTIALIEALHKYDINKNVKFSGYASMVVRSRVNIAWNKFKHGQVSKRWWIPNCSPKYRKVYKSIDMSSASSLDIQVSLEGEETYKDRIATTKQFDSLVLKDEFLYIYNQLNLKEKDLIDQCWIGGVSNKDYGKKLGLSEKTIRNYKYEVLLKFKKEENSFNRTTWNREYYIKNINRYKIKNARARKNRIASDHKKVKI